MRRFRFSSVLIIVGCLLIIAAAALGTLHYIRNRQSKDALPRTVAAIEQLLPPVTDGVPDSLSDTRMAVMNVEGEDYAGLLEIPTQSCTLPIGDFWDKQSALRHPCRYYGSIYEKVLMIGGSGEEGQMAFLTKLSVGDIVYFTDMTGLRVQYAVSDVRRTDDVSTAHLLEREGALLLFARNKNALDYTLVSCTLQ